MFTHAEIERANEQMHARFLSVSGQIFHTLSQLERHIAAAPVGVRMSVISAAGQIASTQQGLRAQIERLPRASWQRFQILRSALDAQQGVLRQLSIIVQQHAPIERYQTAPRASAAPLLQETPLFQDTLLQETWGPAPAPADHHDPAPTREEPIPRVFANAADPSWGRRLRRSRVANHPGGRSAGARRMLALARAQTYPVINGVGLRVLGLLAMVAAGAVLSYGMFPYASEKPNAAAQPGVEISTPSPGAGAARPGAPPVRSSAAAETDAPPASPPAAVRPAIGQMAPASASRPFAAPSNAAAERALPPWDRPVSGPVAAMEPTVPSTARLIPPPASAAPRGAAKEQQAAAAAEPGSAAPAASAGKERFVPVVFTHRDDATAKRFFADLQKQYPKLLGHRQGEPQPVDLANKGVWHRLVVLPPGSRPQAAKLCDELLTAGYDRCWVKAY